MVKNPTKSLAWPFAEKVLRLFLGTALTLLVARQIGPDEFGLFSTIFAIYMLFSALAGLGLKDVLIDEISSGREPTDKVMSTASTLVFTASLPLAFAFISLIKFIYPNSEIQFSVSCFLSIILFLKGLEVLLFGLEAHAELRTISLAQQASIIAGAIGKMAILLTGASALSFASVTTIEFIVLYVAALIFAAKSGVFISIGAFCIKYAVLLLKRSWPLAASSVAVISYFYVDQIIISLLMEAEAAGIYAASSRISQQLYIVPTVLVAAYYPRLTHLYVNCLTTFEEGYKALSVVLMSLGLIIWGIMLLLSDPLLEYLLGGEFKQTGSILKLHALGLVFASLNVISGRWYVMQGLQRLTMMRQLLAAILNVLLNLLLIPFFGLEGAAYATLISLLFLAFGFDLWSAETRKLYALKLDVLRRLSSVHGVKSSFTTVRTL